jgi:hypothetical protein
MKRFNVVVPLADGGVEVHPMKEWLRNNPAHLPAGLHPNSSTSHQLRNALRRTGWVVQELAEEVRLFMPGDSGSAASVEAILGVPDEEEESERDATSFALEAQLRDFIAENLASIPVGGKRLRLYEDSSGRGGVEYPTGVGPIDILAVDDSGTFYVFELKLDRGPDRAMGQLARYMGWMKLNLAGERDVRGVIVARSMDEKLRYAAFIVPNVLLLEYEIQFRVRPVDSIASITPVIAVP